MFNTYDKPQVNKPLNKREIGRLKTLRRRAKWLEHRLEKDTRLLESPDRRELSSLNWVIAYIQECDDKFLRGKAREQI